MTPEELDSLLEDALLVGEGIAELFEDGAVLAAGGAEVRGGEAIAAVLRRHLAGPRRVIQARDHALLLGPSGIGVAYRRDADWRFAILTKEEKA